MEEESFRLGPGLLLDENEHDHRHQMVVFRDDEDEEEKLVECPSASSNEHDMDSDADGEVAGGGGGHMAAGNSSSSLQPAIVNPEPHISAQFYTFNRESHHLMVHCILEGRFASPEEIRSATPPSVLLSWRSVWKDRNEDTAYLTGWKRIQDKLNAHIDELGNEVLYFKNNSQQYVSHINQWQEIVMSFHGDADLKHLGLKETIERIKQVWTVGAKFYGIPESFIRVCIASCVVCCSDVAASAPRNKRRRFEYTESFEVPAKEVPQNLQQLAAKHKVVLCIRQKYIRYKPFMAEVKDYACHRAGEPNTKRSGVLKRERYTSKRCGCGFRIRAIVPITNYNEKDKTFSYQEEGKAIFKLYAVHSGHEPGPHEGSARIIHRFVGQGSLVEQDQVYANEDSADAFALIRKEDADSRMSVLQQVHELRMEIGFLESKIANMSHESLASLSQDLCEITRRLRSVEELPRPTDMLMGKAHSDEVLVTNPGLEEWGQHHHHHDHHHRRQHCSDVKPGEDEDDDIIPQHRFTMRPHTRISQASLQQGKVQLTANDVRSHANTQIPEQYDLVIATTEREALPGKPLLAPLSRMFDSGNGSWTVDTGYKVNFRRNMLAPGCGIWVMGTLADPNVRRDNFSILSASAGRALDSILEVAQAEQKEEAGSKYGQMAML